MLEMRILTVRQPWAWAIIHGGKHVENRVRNLAGEYRGPVAIHVGLSYQYDWQSPALDDAMRPIRNYTPNVSHPWPWEEHLGTIIGVVDLVGVHDSDHCGMCDDGCCGGCSKWAEAGAHHLELANPRPLAEPIPYRGALGLRRLAEGTIAQIRNASC